MLRIVPHTVARVGRSYEHFPDGFELYLLQRTGEQVRTPHVSNLGWAKRRILSIKPERSIRDCMPGVLLEIQRIRVLRIARAEEREGLRAAPQTLLRPARRALSSPASARQEPGPPHLPGWDPWPLLAREHAAESATPPPRSCPS